LILSNIIIMLSSLSVQAQVKVLNRFVQKVNTYKNISYSAITNNTSPFGDTADTVETFLSTHSVQGPQFEFKTSHTRDIFDGKKLLTLDYDSKFFSVNDNYKWAAYHYSSIPLFMLANIVNKALIKSQKMILLPDTMIKKIACFHIRITSSDSTVNSKRSYDITDLYLNKITSFPVYAENNQSGYISKGGVTSDDVFKQVDRSFYLNYKFDQKKKIDLESVKIPADFITMEDYNNKSSNQPLPLLSAGSKAPEWKLQDTKGNYHSSDNVRNKIILIDFFGNYCAPCIMSLPAINRLHERYKDADVEILSVDLDNSTESLKFVDKYKIKYPVCINGKAIADDFHVRGIPTFYIIDKQGNVVSAYDGYSETLEKMLTTQVDKLR